MAAAGGGQGAPHVKDLRTVFVRGVSFDADEKAVEAAFSDVGPVKSCFLVRQKGDAKHKGFGFVQFALPEDAERAVTELDGKAVAGRKLQVLARMGQGHQGTALTGGQRGRPTAQAARGRQRRACGSRRVGTAVEPQASCMRAAWLAWELGKCVLAVRHAAWHSWMSLHLKLQTHPLFFNSTATFACSPGLLHTPASLQGLALHGCALHSTAAWHGFHAIQHIRSACVRMHAATGAH